ncbi:putative toxin-antitoxin system toxin component, PIN family [Corallococcus sp. BB11-1]|uniref:putative toxin-antitoxin system toxin component, PIN family n=1 Tax=Corallococcus sp. BB11-1 TaxID=2996783 RepID=UPI00226F78DD|nr:putative toxin-antitoxin system toxin component, PIN family [Corallococcus sp. BB11-1]MCY1033053.1 putative toxin-antitoxin system toxin component, PIN family [Corallococcus sp. BB11-1]
MSTPSAGPDVRSVVLDTNVVLDLFVYDDAFARPLKEALLAGALTAWVDRHTLRELELVLAYRSFALTAEAQQAVRERYGALTRCSEAGDAVVELPVCRDRDDQKFLVLAARVGAAWLVSKDKRVLSMGGGRRLPFDVLTPRRASLLLESPVSPG